MPEALAETVHAKAQQSMPRHRCIPRIATSSRWVGGADVLSLAGGPFLVVRRLGVERLGLWSKVETSLLSCEDREAFHIGEGRKTVDVYLDSLGSISEEHAGRDVKQLAPLVFAGVHHRETANLERSAPQLVVQ